MGRSGAGNSAARALTFPAGTNLAQMLVGVDPGVVAVAPVDTERVMAYFLDAQHLQSRLEHLEWIPRRRRLRIVTLLRVRAVSAGATGAGALVAEVAQRVFAVMPVFPIDLNALRFRNGDVFRIGLRFYH